VRAEPHLRTAGSSRFAVVDALRTLAVVAVIATHFPSALLHDHPVEPLQSLRRNGWVGVWIFFVISGYVITHTLAERRTAGHEHQPLRAFYRRRFARLYPLAVAVLVLGLAARRWLPDSATKVEIFGARGGVDPHMVIGILTPTLNLMVLIFGKWIWGLAFGLFWSLAIEEQFYLVFPCAFLRCPEQVVRRVLWGLVLIGPAARLLSVIYLPTRPFQVQPLSCFDALALGALLRMQLSPQPEQSRRLGRKQAGLLVVGASMLCAALFSPHLSPRVNAVVLPTLAGWGAVAVLGAIASRPWRVPRWLIRPGERCYGMYLLHAPVLFVVSPLLKRVHPFVGFSVWLGLTMVAAELSFRALEQPMSRWILASRRATVPSCAETVGAQPA
jgi:peptidoglycan/LPS O-acetylase OafA/YrhL